MLGLAAVPADASEQDRRTTFALDHDWYGETITQDADGTYSIPEEVVNELADEAAGLPEGEPQVTAASWRIGRKPIPGDGEPVFGELEPVPGCFVAFLRSGATTPPMMGASSTNHLVLRGR